ncbi:MULTISPECIES: diguanylate cyclase [unclassified Nitrospina]|uniref:diguanylate cyclase n=1 Tax=unclassified Nitrospina TaxID=2638683 RepID=UPI003F98FF0E
MDRLLNEAWVLVVDDRPENIDVLTGILEPEYRIKVALDGHKALEIANANEPPDLILLDVMMPGMDGFEVCRTLKSQDATRDIPVIFITARDGEMDEVQALDLGAVDFIQKPFNPKIARARVRTHVQMRCLLKKNKQMIKELKRANQILDELARRDQLTGLSNRRDMKEKLEIERKRSMRNGKPVSCIVADIDHFKKVNDDHGHLTGDEALKKVSSIISINLRSHDTAARWGGEEFLVLLPETDLEGATHVADRMRSKIESETICMEDREIKLTMSFGVVQFDGKETMEQFLHRADQNLYEAKKNGRNTVVSI